MERGEKHLLDLLERRRTLDARIDSIVDQRGFRVGDRVLYSERDEGLTSAVVLSVDLSLQPPAYEIACVHSPERVISTERPRLRLVDTKVSRGGAGGLRRE